MVNVKLENWAGIEDYVKKQRPKQVVMRLDSDLNTITIRILADNVTLASMAVSAKVKDLQILRMKIKKGLEFPFTLESFEINAGLWKGKFKRK